MGGRLWRRDRKEGSGKKEGVREGRTQVSGRHEEVRKRLSLTKVATGEGEVYKASRTRRKV